MITGIVRKLFLQKQKKKIQLIQVREQVEQNKVISAERSLLERSEKKITHQERDRERERCPMVGARTSHTLILGQLLLMCVYAYVCKYSRFHS